MGDCGCTSGLTTGLAELVAPSYQRKSAQPPSLVLGLRPVLAHSSDSNADLLAMYDVSPRVLAEGTYGKVRRATLRRTGGDCMLKSISTEGLNEEQRSELAEETTILERCDHPNIVRLYASFREPDYFHFTMEACEGEDLHGLLSAQGALNEEDAQLLMKQALHAVFYLHKVKRVAHRDIKPENLLLRFKDVPLAQNVVKLIDLGLAMNFEPNKCSFTSEVGTPEYMAPEMIPGPYNERCDIWSCGVVLHELLSGSVPFQHQHDDLQEIMAMAKETPLFLCGGNWNRVSEDAKDLVRSMCNRKPRMRLSAEQALRSAWFGQQELQSPQSTRPSAESMGKNIREFSVLSDIQKVAVRLAAHHLEDTDVPEEQNVFKALDKRGDGRLSLDDFCRGRSELGLSAPEAEAIFHAVDLDGSGCIEYIEWLSAAIGKERLPDDACWQAFRLGDHNGILEQLHSGASKKVGSPLGSEASSDDSLELEFAEFVALLRGLH